MIFVFFDIKIVKFLCQLEKKHYLCRRKSARGSPRRSSLHSKTYQVRLNPLSIVPPFFYNKNQIVLASLVMDIYKV